MKEALKSLEFFFHDKVSCLSVSKAQMDSLSGQDLDTEGVVNLARDIAGVEVAVFLKEKESNIVKISLRSKTYVDVCAIAKEFGGGGHIRAAGCTVDGSLEQVKKQLLHILEKHI
jgi:phosphoesterase RecJ-like protein